jgi:hypothetical protein
MREPPFCRNLPSVWQLRVFMNLGYQTSVYAGMPESQALYPTGGRARMVTNTGERKNGAQGRNRISVYPFEI